jgi:hypothetical protein
METQETQRPGRQLSINPIPDGPGKHFTASVLTNPVMACRRFDELAVQWLVKSGLS